MARTNSGLPSAVGKVNQAWNASSLNAAAKANTPDSGKGRQPRAERGYLH